MLKDKNIIVTGATRGIGKEIALTLAQNGANIAINYRNYNEEVEELINSIKEFGVDAIAVKCDVSKSDEVDNFISEVKNHFSSIDVLVNNAGITKDGLLLRMKDEDFNSVLDVNLKGTFNTTKSISLVGVAVPVAKEPNKSRRFTLFFLQIMVTFSMISEIGITFMIHSCPPLPGKF